MRNRLVVGNWKMNGTRQGNEALLRGLLESPLVEVVETVVCPPFPYIDQVSALVRGSGLSVGAQNLSAFPAGAHTGEVSAAMLVDLGCTWVILGHSERRAAFAESDGLVLEKTRVALGAGLRPIVCVGETLAQREAGQAEQVVGAQLEALLAGLDSDGVAGLVVAYEPVWAIGTGRTASPEQAQEMHVFIRGRLAASGLGGGGVRVLYGGSVTADNAAALFAMPDIDGALVGGASLVAGSFLAICAAAARVTSGI